MAGGYFYHLVRHRMPQRLLAIIVNILWFQMQANTTSSSCDRKIPRIVPIRATPNCA